MRLGVPVPVSHWSRSSSCGDTLEENGYHLTSGGLVWTHDSVEIQITSDIAFNYGAACNCNLDIAMAQPLSADVLPQSGVTKGIAAKQREDGKEATDKKFCSPTKVQSNVNFLVPLVFKH